MKQRDMKTPILPLSEYVQSLEKGLAVIKAFNEQTPVRTLAEVAGAVGLTRAAARRFVLTLEALGYVARVNKAYCLTPRVMELGYSFLASQPWRRHAQAVINLLGARIECSCAVSVLDREAIAYVAFTPGGTTQNVVRSVGTRLPAYATAMGRVLMAGFDERKLRELLNNTSPQRLTPFTDDDINDLVARIAEARMAGYAIVSQQLEIGLYSIGVPVFDRGGDVVAGLSASVRGFQISNETLVRDYLEPLRQAARDITDGLPF